MEKYHQIENKKHLKFKGQVQGLRFYEELHQPKGSPLLALWGDSWFRTVYTEIPTGKDFDKLRKNIKLLSFSSNYGGTPQRIKKSGMDFDGNETVVPKDGWNEDAQDPVNLGQQTWATLCGKQIAYEDASIKQLMKWEGIVTAQVRNRQSALTQRILSELKISEGGGGFKAPNNEIRKLLDGYQKLICDLIDKSSDLTKYMTYRIMRRK